MSSISLTALPTYLIQGNDERPSKVPMSPKESSLPPPQENREELEYTSAKELNDTLESLK